MKSDFFLRILFRTCQVDFQISRVLHTAWKVNDFLKIRKVKAEKKDENYVCYDTVSERMLLKIVLT